jgi:hypothetical protein
MRKATCLGILSLLLLQGCMAGNNPLVDTVNFSGGTAGFFSGIWHGLIFPISFFLSLFMDSVSVYEVHNSGGWYNFGFLLGASMTLGGGGSAASNGS